MEIIEARNMFSGTDEELIVSVICRRSYGQLKKIERVYQQMFGAVLMEDLKDDLSGYFEKLSLALFRSNIEQDVVNLKEAIDVSIASSFSSEGWSLGALLLQD